MRYEKLGRDVRHTRIVKMAMRRLGTDPDLDRVQIHRGNAGYGFLLNLCRLVSRRPFPEHRCWTE